MPSRMINGYELHYAESGSGEPLVLVHGTLNDQRSWAAQMQVLGERYHVHALSLRHFWPAQWDGTGPGFTIAQHTDDVAAFLRSFGRPVRLIGHSRGGHIAFRVAQQYPDVVGDLVLAEPGGELDETLGGKPATGAQAAGFARAAAEVAAGRVLEGMIMQAEATGGPGAWQRRPEIRRQIAMDNARTLLGQVNENRLPFSRAAAQAIRSRTLLLNGALTQPNFITVIEALAPVIADCRRQVIPNATHGMQADNPAAFNAAVLDFFAGG